MHGKWKKKTQPNTIEERRTIIKLKFPVGVFVHMQERD
jgi:hypothetical protein